MPAARVGLLYSAVQTDVVTQATITAATTNAVSAGNTVFITGSARGATAGTATISGLPGDAVIETPLNRTNAASPAVSLWRIYLPSGMPASTSITITWDSTCTRRTLQGVVYSGVANANVLTSAGANAASNVPTAGTTAATTTTTGVHVASWGLNAALGTVTGSAPVDADGSMQEEGDQVVGASTFHYLYFASDTETAAHAGGETAAFTPAGTYASWAGVQGVWDGAVVGSVATQFDELTAEPLLTGPWASGPIMFSEVRDELIFIAPPSDQILSPPVATASASAPVPQIIISLPAPAATASASSLVPVPQIGIPAPVATAAASAPVPVPQVRVLPAAATASASSPVPTLQAGIVVPVATASANSPPPVPQIVILAPAATASASAPVPTIITGTIVSPPAATASASAPAPTITISLAPPAATSSASAPVPVPQVRLSPPAATASASSPAPTPQLRISPAAATASASAPVPVPQVRLLPPASTASASALVPTVTVVGGGGGPAATVAMFGYVTGLPASGTVTALGDGGLVLVGSSGTLGQTGASGLVGSAYAPIHICPLGVTDQALGGVVIADVETLIGRQFHGLRQNADISTNWVNTGQHIAQFDTGRTASYRACQNDPATETYAAAIAGTYDARFTTTVNNIVNSHRWTTANPFILCYGHEVTVASWDPLGTKQQFIDSFRHFRLLLDSLGASVTSVTGAAVGGPIIMAYVGWDRMFTNGTVNVPTAGKAYTDYDPDQGSSPAPPGTTYYTLVGSDVYNNIVSGSLQYGTNAATLLDDIVLQARNRNKDWMIGEIACADGSTTQSHQDKAAWWDSVRVYLDGLGTTSPGVCRYMFTTIKADSNNYNVDSSAESLAAWRRLGFDVYYA